MKVTKFLLIGLFSIGIQSVKAQEKKGLTLNEAINIAISKSSTIALATAKAETKNYESQSMKNNLYPDMRASGQLLHLSNANINSNLNSNSSNSNSPIAVNQVILGQINTGLPLFSGFKLRNSVIASTHLYSSEKARLEQTKENIAMEIIENYANLYRAQKAVILITDNLKSAAQRVSDFTALEKNGIIARNDLLKAQLQQSKVQLALDEAYKNVSVFNYDLITLLKLPADFKIDIDENQFGNNQPINTTNDIEIALKNRKDLEAIHFLQKASENNIKIAKSAYFPTINLTGGLIYLDLKNTLTVSNAVNFGVGLSYDFASIFKNGTNVKTAKSKALEMLETESILSEKIKTQVHEANENYNLSLKQNLVYEQAIDQAKENYRIVKDKYDNGLSNTTELLEADVEQLNSKINYAYSRANVMLKYYEMQFAAGQLLPSFQLTKN
jgi:outer membrane protein TolC